MFSSDYDDSSTPYELLFVQGLVQNRKYTEIQWTITSLDIVMGLIGGFIGLIWDTLGLTLKGYESFKFSSSFIGEIYSTTESQRMKRGAEPSNLDSA